jgi:hypothetical protein
MRARVSCQVSSGDVLSMAVAMGGTEEDLEKIFQLDAIFKRLNPNAGK